MSYKYTVIRFVALFLAFATFIGFFPLNALAKQEEKVILQAEFLKNLMLLQVLQQRGF